MEGEELDFTGGLMDGVSVGISVDSMHDDIADNDFEFLTWKK